MKSYWPFFVLPLIAVFVFILHPDQVAADMKEVNIGKLVISMAIAIAVIGSGALLIRYGTPFLRCTGVVKRVANIIYDVFFFNISRNFQRLKIPLLLYFIIWVCYMYLIVNGKHHFRWHSHYTPHGGGLTSF
jgi:hypothetical protein